MGLTKVTYSMIEGSPVNLLDYGADPTGSDDSTTAVQAAIDAITDDGVAYALYVPAGKYRLTAPVDITKGIAIIGDGCEPYYGSLANQVGTMGNGSWFHIDHTGVGFNVDGSVPISGVEFNKIGTYRNQPTTLTSGWTPNNNDYDIYIDSADVYINDVMLLNPTKGVYLTNGNYGRLEVNRLRGQAFQTLIHVHQSYDVVKLNNVHQWSFWADDADVHSYMNTHLDTIYFERVDNPQISNLFSINHNSGIRIGQTTNGTTSKLHAVNCDLDLGRIGIWIDTTVTNGVTGQFENITTQSTSISNSTGVYVQGANCILQFNNLDIVNVSGNGVYVATNNSVNLGGNTRISYYDQSSGGFPAIEAIGAAIVQIVGNPSIDNGGSGPAFSSTGTIYADVWRDFSPTITAGSGTLATWTATGKYKLYNNTCYYQIDASITNNGTGSDYIKSTLPATCALDCIGVGRELNSTGKLLQSVVRSGNAYTELRNYDNSYPAATGYRLIADGFFKI